MSSISLSVKLDITRIITPGRPVKSDARAVDLYSDAQEDNEVNEYFVIDRNGSPCGIVTKRKLAPTSAASTATAFTQDHASLTS